MSLLAARPLPAAAAPAPAQALSATLADDPLVPEQYHLKLTGTEAAWQSRTSAEAIKVCVVGEWRLAAGRQQQAGLLPGVPKRGIGLCWFVVPADGPWEEEPQVSPCPP